MAYGDFAGPENDTGAEPLGSWLGYRREDGRYATRNEIWLIPTVGCVAPMCEMLAREAEMRHGDAIAAGKIDGIVGDLVAAEMRAHPDAVIALVSDHGFEATHTAINLYRPFIDAGLITLDRDGKIASWLAMPWIAGGSAAIMLARPDDAGLKARVKTLLDRLAANPANGIDQIVDHDRLVSMGGNPQASFAVNLKPGFVTDIFRGAAAPVTGPSPVKGMHGYFPSPAALDATLLLLGEGIPAGKDLGRIDMRAIAPTLATIMGADLPTAQVEALDIED